MIERRANPNRRRTARSGDHTRDPRFDAEERFEVVNAGESRARMSAAIDAFGEDFDSNAFERAVAVYVRSARERAEPVEHVLAALTDLLRVVDERYVHKGKLLDPSAAQTLVIRGVLLAFYGP